MKPFINRSSLFRLPSLLALTAVALTLAACGGRGDKRDKDTVVIWQGFKTEEVVVFRELMKEFEADYLKRTGREVHVQVEFVSYDDMVTKLKTAALAKITPDVAFIDSIKVTDLAFGRALVEVDQLDSFKRTFKTIEGARAEFVQASFDAGMVNRLGQVNLYGLPVQTTTVALFWNRELFRQKGRELQAAGLDPSRAPRDWDELLAYGKILTDPVRGIHAYGMSGSLWFNFPMFNMYGVEFVAYDDKGRATATLDSPNMAACLNRIRQIVASGVEGGAWKRSALGPDAGFINKRYAMVFMGPWIVENFTNAGLDFDIAMIPAPSKDEIAKLNLPPKRADKVEEWGPLAWSSSNVGGQTGVIMRTAADPDLAFEVLAFFTSEPIQRRFASSLGQIPTRLSAWEGLDTSKYPFLPRFMDQLSVARRIPQLPRYSIMESNIFNPEFDLLLQKPDYPVERMMQNISKGLEAEILSRVNEAIPDARP